MRTLMTLTSATASARPLFGRLPGALSARPCAWRPRRGAGDGAGSVPRLPAPAQLARGPAPPRANFFQEAWGTNNAEELQTLAQALSANIFAVSIIPYAAFLYYLTKSKAAPPLMLFGWYFLLAFVGVSIPAGIYAKVHYGTTLANVDWLHGGAEVLLTMTNLFIVLGTRQAIRELQAEKQRGPAAEDAGVRQQQQTVPADD